MKKSIMLVVLALILMSCGKDGMPGPQGAPGLNGADGVAGATGVTGPQGSAGQDAPGVTVVTLCQDTTVYPNTFAEVAFCLGGKLYAVYSARGGFESEIPPGTYTSNGVNSSCTFTVQPNCVVTR